MERQSWYLALFGFRSHALWRAFFRLCFPSAGCRAWSVASRITQRACWHDEHGDSNRFLGYGRDGVGITEDAPVQRLLVVHAGYDLVWRDLPGRKAHLRMAAEIRPLRCFYQKRR